MLRRKKMYCIRLGFLMTIFLGIAVFSFSMVMVGGYSDGNFQACEFDASQGGVKEQHYLYLMYI